MSKLVATASAILALACFGCVSQSAGTPISPGEDAGFPDGGVLPTVDASLDGSIFGEAGDASAFFSTGLGSGVVAHSAHFTLVTKTGTEPGGAGVRSSKSFKMISGVTPAATK
jgi:hypothetical protein